MPIALLSDDTTRAISSSLVLNDAISVVKELLDNALDSHATNITIEISANTLDTIQVRDNGSGIGIEDRQLLCRRGYTSKIRTFEDLAQLGGCFLGFRGEALASIAELSASVTFTTRVDGETVATSLKFDSKGKLASCSSASHSTGTTVRVSDFLKRIPVRKQTALKQATKTLSNVKKLLFDYAFARPTIRFQFKVLKSKSDLKDNWSYAPCKDASNLILVASKIVGKEVALQCRQQSIASDDGSYRIDALLIAKECDVSKLGSSNKYISIDGRPVTAERGLMKDLSKTYKAYLRNAAQEITNHPAKQFICLRLECPRGSYDINVEPAKDQVLFEDSVKVLQLFEKLCVNTYGETMTGSGAGNASSKSMKAAGDHGFDILLAKKVAPSADSAHAQPAKSTDHDTGRPRKLPTGDALRESSDDPDIRIMKRGPNDDQVNGRTQWSMYALDDNEFEVQDNKTSNRSETSLAEDEEDVMNAQVKNPFVLAKMSTRVRSQSLSLPENVPARREADSASVNEHGHSEHRSPTSNEAGISASSRLLPSPSLSSDYCVPYQNPGPPNRPWRSRHEHEDDTAGLDLPVTPTTQTTQPPRPTLLDSWARTVNSSSPVEHSSPLLGAQRFEPLSKSIGPSQQSFDKTNNIERSEAPTKSSRRFQQSTFQTPFKSSGKSPRRSPQDSEASIPVPFQASKQNQQSMLPSPAPTRSNVNPDFLGFRRPQHDPSTELNDIMDFEHRKRDTILQHRGRRRGVQPTDSEPILNQGEAEDQRFLVPSSPYNEDEARKATSEGIDYASRSQSKDTDMGIPQQPNSGSYTQNPHRNRYRKAVRDLGQREGAENEHEGISLGGQNRDDIAESARRQPDPMLHAAKLTPHDPRAYLIRQEDGSNSSDNARKKLSQVKTVKLPFEVIPVDFATYMLVAKFNVEDHSKQKDSMRASAAQLEERDTYVRSGMIVPAMSGAVIERATLQEWEAVIWRLVQEKVLSHISCATPEQTFANLNTDLSGILQKHFAQFKGN